MDKRPRRSSTHKKTDINEGLLWQEERELTRALYASLQRPRSEQDDLEEELQHREQLHLDDALHQSHIDPSELPDMPVDSEDFVRNLAIGRVIDPLLEPERLTDRCISDSEEQNLVEAIGHAHDEEDSSIDHLVLDHTDVSHTVMNHDLGDVEHSEEPLNITDPDHNDIQATEEFHDFNIAIDHPQPELRPVEKRVRKPKDPVKPKRPHKRKETSVVKDSAKSKRTAKVERPLKPRGLSKSKQSGETKQSHKKKVLPQKAESSRISKARSGSSKKLSKPEAPEPIVTRSRSPKTSSPVLAVSKPKEVAKDPADSIAHRLRASVTHNSGNGMGNVLGQSSRSKENKQISEVNADNVVVPNKSKNSGDFLPPPPLPAPLLPLKPKSNAAVPLKQSVTKCTSSKKRLVVTRDKSSTKAKPVPSIHGKNHTPNSIPKRPLRSLRRDLRSRTKFKMPPARPVPSPTTRRTTRSQSTPLSSSSSSGVSSSNESQDEAKSSSASESRCLRIRKGKERLVPKRKSSTAQISSTSAEEDDDRGSKPKKTKVQAQRKFAYPQAYSPGCTPSKVKNGDMMSSSKSYSIFNHCPSTEDFLTFLCLRGTPALPPSLDLFKVQSKPTPSFLQLQSQSMPKQLAGRKRSSSNTFRTNSTGGINIPGIEPLPGDDSAPSTPTSTPTRTPPRVGKTSPRPARTEGAAAASPSLLQKKMKIRERRLRLDARNFKASGKLTKNLRSSFKSNQKNIVSNGPPLQRPPNLSPVPPPILAAQRNRHPPPLIPIVPWENKRCQTNNHQSSRRNNAAQVTGRKSSSVRSNSTRSSGRSSSRNRVPSKNNNNYMLDKQEDQSPVIATSKAKNKRRETRQNSDKHGRISERLRNDRCHGKVINGSNHLLDKLDSTPNGHILLSQIKLLKGSGRERKEKKCSCHSQNCSQRTRSRHKNGDRDLAIEGAIEEVLKTAKRQKKLKELKRRSSRKLRNSSMMLRDRVQAAEVELDDTITDKADAINSILSTNGISKKLTIPLTNCTLNNNVLRKDSMICPKAHLNHEIEKKLTELKIKEDGEEEDSPVPKPTKARNPLLLKNHKEQLPSKATPETPLQKLQRKPQAQSPSRNRAKTKNGLAPVKSSKEEVPVQSGPSKFVEGVREGLVLRPTAEEWNDPMVYLESVADQLNEYGMCRVIPPNGWKPECKLHANTRFTTDVQYIHRLMHRWKSRSKQLACIKRHLEEREKVAYYPPQISGYEIDLVEFSKVVAQQGGLKTITNNKRWSKVADLLHIPKALQSRVKLDSIYCKFLLSFDTLSQEDKQRLEMETELLRKQQIASRLRSHDHEHISSEEVMCKGRPTTLSAYSRMASLTQQMLYTRQDPPIETVEDDYWKMVDSGEPHVAVHVGQLNATLTTSGFTTNKTNPYAKHNWNCKNIGKNPGNVLNLLPNNLGVNMPLMKISMLYGSEGWSIDSHGFSQIEYLHTGSPKIWYGVPTNYCNKLEELLQSEVPDLCTYQQHCLYRNNLHCMVPPSVLSCKGVPVYRLVQEPGEFIVVAHGAAKANFSTGYTMSEAIPFASVNNIHYCLKAFEICQKLKQPTLFSVEHLLCVLTTNAANLEINPSLLRDLRTKLTLIRDGELSLRHQLVSAGLKSSICFADSETCEDGPSLQAGTKARSQHASDKGCHVCRQPCYLSMVVSEREDRVYCLHHAYQMITKTKISPRNFKLLYRYCESQLRDLGSCNHADKTTLSTHSTSVTKAPTSKGTSATLSSASATKTTSKGAASVSQPTTAATKVTLSKGASVAQQTATSMKATTSKGASATQHTTAATKPTSKGASLLQLATGATKATSKGASLTQVTTAATKPTSKGVSLLQPATVATKATPKGASLVQPATVATKATSKGASLTQVTTVATKATPKGASLLQPATVATKATSKGASLTQVTTAATKLITKGASTTVAASKAVSTTPSTTMAATNITSSKVIPVMLPTTASVKTPMLNSASTSHSSIVTTKATSSDASSATCSSTLLTKEMASKASTVVSSPTSAIKGATSKATSASLQTTAATKSTSQKVASTSYLPNAATKTTLSRNTSTSTTQPTSAAATKTMGVDSTSKSSLSHLSTTSTGPLSSQPPLPPAQQLSSQTSQSTSLPLTIKDTAPFSSASSSLSSPAIASGLNTSAALPDSRLRKKAER